MLGLQDFTKYSGAYAQSNLAVIDNFLDDATANKFHDYFMELQSSEWDVTFKPKFPNQREVKNKPELQGYLSNVRRQAIAANAENALAMFYLTLATHDTTHSDPMVCEAARIFSSAEFYQAVKDVTSLDVDNRHTQIARLEPGHFIGRHFDTGPARLSFVLHLSRDWKQEWGGMFVDYSKEQPRLVLPVFNRLVIFDKTGTALPHAVEMVAMNSPSNRLVIAGHLN